MVTTHSSWGIKSSISTSPLTVAISVRRSSENLRFISRASSLTMASPPALAGQDGVEVGDVGVELVQLVFNLQNLQPSQLAQLELADGVGLQIVKAEALHQRGLGLGPAALAGPDGGDNLVHNVDGLFQALQNVGAVLGLFQVELGAAGDDLHLELDVLLQNLPQVQQLGARPLQWPA